MIAHQTRINDLGIAWEAELRNPNGYLADLTGKTVALKIKRTGGTTVTRSCTVTLAGRVRYEPVTADVATAETLQLQWKVTDGNGKVVSYPNRSFVTLVINAD